MALEIEHKYLVKDDSFKQMATEAIDIVQGYLSRDPMRVVRVRLIGNRGYITVKGITKGDSRLEFEYEIPYDDAEKMILLCEPPLLYKTRYIVPYKGFNWEIDVYGGSLSPLTVAEIELPSSDTPYALPSFIGENVTGNPDYYNSNLIK